MPEYKTHKMQDLSWRSDILESDLAHPLPAKQAQKHKQKAMIRFEAKIMNLSVSPGGQVKTGHLELLSFIKTLPQQDGILDKGLFDINVRANTIPQKKGKKEDSKTEPKISKKGLSGHAVFDGIADTLRRIENGDNPDLFIMKNVGCWINVDSCVPVAGKPDYYEIVFSKSHHGFGNGQHSIRSAFYSWNSLGIDILPGTCIIAKITEGLDPDKSVEICHSNNNSKSINNKDKVSNLFSRAGLIEEMARRGYLLKAKRDTDQDCIDLAPYPKGVIDLHDRKGFYNLLNAYRMETPWKAGQEVVDEELLEGLDADLLETVFESMKDIDCWIDRNKEEIFQYKKNFDEQHLGQYGLLRNLFATCIKLLSEKKLVKFKTEISIGEFLDLCFESFKYSMPAGADGKKSLKNESFARSMIRELSRMLEMRQYKVLFGIESLEDISA